MEYTWITKLAPYKDKLFTGEWPTITQAFQITLSKFPDKPCFTTFNPNRLTYTFADVNAHLLRISSYLREKGLTPGDKVVINGKNSIEWALSYLAINFAGGIVVPLDNQMNKDRLIQLIRFCDAKYIIADTMVLNNIQKKDASLLSEMKEVIRMTGKGPGEYPTLRTIQPSSIKEAYCGKETDIAAILFTSGTTGMEKGVVLTQKNIISDAFQVCDPNYLPVSEQDVLYALLPLHHSYCCTAVLIETVVIGCECVFGHGIVISRMINDLKQGNITFFMGIPLLYNKLLNGMLKEIKKKGPLINAYVHTLMWINGFFKKYFNKNPLRRYFNKILLDKIGFAHNKILICGAGPLAPRVFKQYQQLGLDFIQGYGLTETSPIVALNPTYHFKVDSVGKILPLIDAKIIDKDEKGIGELVVKGPITTQGYYKDKENTKHLFTEDGYLKTGDLGYLDKENYMFLKGRTKNVIVTEGGKNVFPEEIEDLFQLYSQVDQILIRGYQQKKEYPTEMIEAVIYPSKEYFAGKENTKEDEINTIISAINKNLSGYKKITKVTLVDHPMATTSTRKIKRNLVR